MWLVQHKDLIDVISQIATSVGTIGAVIVALYFSHNDNKVKLKPTAFIGLVLPNNVQFLWLCCINNGKPAAICTGLSFAPNRFARLRIMPTPNSLLVGGKNCQLPSLLRAGEKVDQHYDIHALSDDSFKNLLGNYKYLAKIRLKYLWRLVATTNLSRHYGKLSNDLVEHILSVHFPEKKCSVLSTNNP